jgi:hypothetical protein
MPVERTEVIFYSGYRAEETPRSFTVGGKRIEVIEILDRWIEEGLDDRARKRFFKVKGSDGMTYKIYRDERTREWFIHQK